MESSTDPPRYPQNLCQFQIKSDWLTEINSFICQSFGLRNSYECFSMSEYDNSKIHLKVDKSRQ